MTYNANRIKFTKMVKIGNIEVIDNYVSMLAVSMWVLCGIVSFDSRILPMHVTAFEVLKTCDTEPIFAKRYSIFYKTLTPLNTSESLFYTVIMLFCPTLCVCVCNCPHACTAYMCLYVLC